MENLIPHPPQSSISPTAIRNYRNRYFDLGASKRPWWWIHPMRIPTTALEIRHVHGDTRAWIVSTFNSLNGEQEFIAITEHGSLIQMAPADFSYVK